METREGGHISEKIGILLVVGAMFLTALPVVAAGKSDTKVDVCHLENKNSHNFHLINK